MPFEERGAVGLAERLEVLAHVWDHIRAYGLFYRNIVEFQGSRDTPRIYAIPGPALD